MPLTDHLPESHTDVLIVGAGPSGLMTAYWMARYGIRTRIIDKRETKVFTGHADGIRMRTLEIFDSMGIHHRVDHEGHPAVEPGFWVPGKDGHLMRQGPITPSQVFESPMHHMLLNQGRIERFLLDSIRENSDIEVERGVTAESLEYDETLDADPNAYPISVKIHTAGCKKNLTVPEDLSAGEWEDLTRQRQKRQATSEVIKAKYIIGCDGAHSWTRKQLDIPFEGETTEHIWGVVDVIPISDFPDIRRMGTVTSTSGTILVIPRERKLVRFYVPVHIADGTVGDRFDRSTITPEKIKERVQAILSPYTFDFSICDWWTVYQIGQRIAPTFAKGNRAFLAGDAVHTHSPKVGLGMNVSMQDGFNIGWKVALVAAGVATPDILSTCNTERHRIAELLLEYDKFWSTYFTTDEKPPGDDAPGKTERMIKTVERFQDFADGVKAFYGQSHLVWKTGDEMGPACATKLIPGERVPPAKLRQPADATIKWTTRIMESDGPFRLVVLAGDIRNPEQKQRVDSLAKYLSGLNESNSSILTRYASLPGQPDGIIDVLTIHSAPWTEVEFFDFPEGLRWFDPVMGWSYEKIWCDDACSWDRDCDGKSYEKWGVDRTRGAMFILRPDQYIGWAGELEEVEDMVSYLDGFLTRSSSPATVGELPVF